MFHTIGIIGSGPVALAVAGHAVGAGHPVLISNRRGPESLKRVIDELGPGASAATVQEAAQADVVLLAVPFSRIPEVAKAVSDWSQRVVIDATNQFAQEDPYSGRADIGDLSGSEWVEGHLAGAKIIKAFNAMYSSYIAADPVHQEGRQVVFYAGDHEAEKELFATLVDSFGFAAVDLGALRAGGRLMQLDGQLSAVHMLKQN
jgi:predicted dinucleotide-binding enzyme